MVKLVLFSNIHFLDFNNAIQDIIGKSWAKSMGELCTVFAISYVRLFQNIKAIFKKSIFKSYFKKIISRIISYRYITGSFWCYG